MDIRKMRKRFLIERLYSLMEAVDYIDLGKPEDVIEFSQQLNALGYTMYLEAKTDKKLTREEEILIAQSFNNQMLRGLYDLIDLREEDFNEMLNDIMCSIFGSSKSKKPGGK